MFEVNSLHYDVPQAHLIEFVRAQLQLLDGAGRELVTVCQHRLSSYRKRLASLQQRIESVDERVKRVPDKRAAVVIYSPSSYLVPEEQQGECFQVLIPERSLLSLAHTEDRHRFSSSGPFNSGENLRFFTLKAYDEITADFYEQTPKGRGRLAERNLKSIADVLVFNSSVNPYSVERNGVEARDIDRSASAGPMESSLEDVQIMSCVDRTDSDFKEGSDEDEVSIYRPQFPSMPDLRLPPNLPKSNGLIYDLPRAPLLAESVTPAPKNRWEDDAQDENKLFQPNVDSPRCFVAKSSNRQSNENSTSLKNSRSDSRADSRDSAHNSLEPVLELPVSPPVIPLQQPCLPSPAELLLDTSSEWKSEPSAKLTSTAAKSSLCGRETLLAAIRDHGGLKRLKATSSVSMQAGDSEKPKQGVPSSHIDALKERLKMRSAKTDSPKAQGIDGILEDVMKKMAEANLGSNTSSADSDTENDEWT